MGQGISMFGFFKKKTVEDESSDLYKSLSKAIQKSVPRNWAKVTVKIESSLNVMCSFQSECLLSSNEKRELKFPVQTASDLIDAVFELQEAMYLEHKWNRSVYTLEKNGHFDMEFIWDKELQDEWDKA